ncbi:sigma-70 family RNA polymerase sigma factor [Plantactinospora sp. WMMB334]|uniref:sigma-70 family RNA polymerase sigma factor n=1 Tax=Plantactinospora sp. WMMB334 TaxID=3404119 RepID=UPI003B942C7F
MTASAPPFDFDAFVRNERTTLLRVVAAQTMDWHVAEDAVQEALLTAWQEQAQYEVREDSSPLGWVITIAKYRAMSALKAQRRILSTGDWVERFAEIEDRPTDSGLPCMADPDVCERVAAALEVLPPGQRQVVEMHCLQGLPLCEIAKQLGITESAVGWQLKTALGRTDWTPPPPRKAVHDGGVSGWFNDANLPVGFSKAEVLAALTAKQREVVRLRLVEGMTYTRIANKMGICPSAVDGLMERAKATMRRVLAGDPPPPSKPTYRPGPSSTALEVLNTPALFNRLTSRQQDVLRLRYRDGLSCKETATRVGGMTPNAVKKLVWNICDRVEAARREVPYSFPVASRSMAAKANAS